MDWFSSLPLELLIDKICPYLNPSEYLNVGKTSYRLNTIIKANKDRYFKLTARIQSIKLSRMTNKQWFVHPLIKTLGLDKAMIEIIASIYFIETTFTGRISYSNDLYVIDGGVKAEIEFTPGNAVAQGRVHYDLITTFLNYKLEGSYTFSPLLFDQYYILIYYTFYDKGRNYLDCTILVNRLNIKLYEKGRVLAFAIYDFEYLDDWIVHNNRPLLSIFMQTYPQANPAFQYWDVVQKFYFEIINGQYPNLIPISRKEINNTNGFMLVYKIKDHHETLEKMWEWLPSDNNVERLYLRELSYKERYYVNYYLSEYPPDSGDVLFSSIIDKNSYLKQIQDLNNKHKNNVLRLRTTGIIEANSFDALFPKPPVARIIPIVRVTPGGSRDLTGLSPSMRTLHLSAIQGQPESIHGIDPSITTGHGYYY